MSKNGIIKLVDFGVATLLTDNNNTQTCTGTFFWSKILDLNNIVAPEVIETKGKATGKCDIWSLGCTIIELLTGKPPNSDKNPLVALSCAVKDEMPIPEEFSEVKFQVKFIRMPRIL